MTMRWTATARARWVAFVTSSLLLCGCGESSRESPPPPPARTVTTPPSPARAHLGELLSVPAVGRIYGRCNPGDRRWTIRFINDAPATDSVTYRVGTGRSRTVRVDPSRALAWRLVPSQYTSHEPPDPGSHFPATATKTTEPVTLHVSQGTEPHIYSVNIRLAVAAAIGD